MTKKGFFNKLLRSQPRKLMLILKMAKGALKHLPRTFTFQARLCLNSLKQRLTEKRKRFSSNCENKCVYIRLGPLLANNYLVFPSNTIFFQILSDWKWMVQGVLSAALIMFGCLGNLLAFIILSKPGM